MENFEGALGMFGISFVDEHGNEIEKFQPDNLAVVHNYYLYG